MFDMLTNGSSRMMLTTPRNHHSNIQQRAKGAKWMFGYCILYYGKAPILQLQLLHLFGNTWIVLAHQWLSCAPLHPSHQYLPAAQRPSPQANPDPLPPPHHCSRLQYPLAIKDAKINLNNQNNNTSNVKWSTSTFVQSAYRTKNTFFSKSLIYTGTHALPSNYLVADPQHLYVLWKGVVVIKDWFSTVSTLGGCVGLERTDL